MIRNTVDISDQVSVFNQPVNLPQIDFAPTITFLFCCKANESLVYFRRIIS